MSINAKLDRTRTSMTSTWRRATDWKNGRRELRNQVSGPEFCGCCQHQDCLDLKRVGWIIRQALLVLVVLLPFATAIARDEPRLEAFGGYSWLSTSLLQDTGFIQAREGFSGWNSSLDWNTTHNLGFVAEASGFLGSPSQDNSTARTRYYSFLAGPKITHHNHTDKVEVFVHQLFGMSHATVNSATRSLTASGFSLAAGFGMDFVVRKHLSLRPVQVDYMISQLAPHSQNQFRISTGVMLRWAFVERDSACSQCSSGASNFKKAE